MVLRTADVSLKDTLRPPLVNNNVTTLELFLIVFTAEELARVLFL